MSDAIDPLTSIKSSIKDKLMADDNNNNNSKSPSKEKVNAAEIAARDLLGQPDGEDITASFRKKKASSTTPTSTTNQNAPVNFGGEGGPRRSRSHSPSEMSVDPPENTNTSDYPHSITKIHTPSARNPTDAASISSFRSYASTTARSIDPESGDTISLGEIWEVSRPPNLVRDGGNDHGYFYLPSPSSADSFAFQAFLTNQKYTTRKAPCLDPRSWVDHNPGCVLIHFSEVPREAVVKGRHILETRPGSAFFSQRQLVIDEDNLDEMWEDSGSYAQMFAFAARDAAASGGDGGKRGFAQEVVVPKEDPDNVSFLRKGFNQNIVAGIVAFTGPGLFNAMQGLGNAGGSDPSVAATMNATLYATFSIFGVLSGSLFNLLGTKILMSFGALTYAFYAISVYLWGQVDDSYAPMAVAAAAILGIGAACLWGAQGTMTLSYALENQKGLFFGLFWLIFNMGGVMGGFISMGINLSPDEDRATSVTPETYFTFCGLMIAGSVFAFFFVLKPSRVIKADGTPVQFEQTDAAEGFGELKQVASLFGNRYMLLLTPLIIQSNWFYAYEFGGINGLLFDAPTRGLNSAVYWFVSGISSYVGGTYYLDRESVGARRQRAIRGLLVISAINVGQWIYALIYQFSTGYDKGNAPDPPINFKDGGTFWVPFLLFVYCGLADSLVQTYAYWIIGSISNDPKELSMFVGYYKGVQSFGAALSWIIEAKGTSYRAQLVICSFLAVLFIIPTYMVATCVQDKGGMTVAPDTDRNKTEMTQNRRHRDDGSHSGRSQVSRSSQSQTNRSQTNRSQTNRSQGSRGQVTSQRSARMASQKRTPSARAVMT